MTKPIEYHFADCRLSAATRELWLRGERQPIQPRVLDFLIYLIEQRERVVGKDELIARVWDGEMLTDGVLARAASKARKAIGDHVDGPMLVRTIHSVGYRFIGDVRTVEPRTRDWPLWPAGHSAAMERGLPAPGTPVATLSAEPSVETATARLSAVLPVRYFARNEELSGWTAVIDSLRGEQRLDTLLALAWHLRQRDTRRALEMADEADALIGTSCEGKSLRGRVRLMLVRGEAKWLFGQMHAAMDLAQQAASLSEGNGDLAGFCDAALLQAAIAADLDDPGLRKACVDAALDKGSSLADEERHALLQLHLAHADALLDVNGAEAIWSPRLAGWMSRCGPGVQASCRYVEATLAAASGDRARRLRLALAARDLYAEVGQLREVIRESGNAGAMFSNLFDNDAALEWMTTALAQARAVGWPLSLAACLAQTAATIGIMLKRPAEAVGLLEEARELLVAYPGHRVTLNVLRYHGDIQLALGEFEVARHAFEESVSLARARRLVWFEADALIGHARALSRLLHDDEAREAAVAALVLAEEHGNDYYQFLALETLAGIHRDHPDLPHRAVEEGSVVLHYLLRALVKQRTDNPETAPASLLESLAIEYARLGEYEMAYSHQVRSRMAYAQTQSAEISGRAISMTIRHDVERAQAQIEHHRAVAQAHAERAEALAQNNATLARMADIGQQITRHLEAQAIFDALAHHANGLLDASSLAVFVVDSSGTLLELAFGVEAGRPLPSLLVAVSDPTANVARCARECREILLTDDGLAGAMETLPARSALFAPLCIGTRVLGVMTVQSPVAHAYGERDLLVMRSLSAYAAVALENAAAYHRLESARDVLALTHAEMLDKDKELESVRRALQNTRA